MRSKVRIGPQSLSYGFQNEIMNDHVQMGDSKTIGMDVTNLMNDVSNFVKYVLRVPKCVPRWGLTPNHSLMGSKMKSWIIHVQMRVLKTIGTNVPNLMNDVPNLVKDVPRVPKYIPRWGSTLNHFLMVSKMKLWTIHVRMGNPKAIGSDVPNLMTDVPNLIKNVPNFVKDVSRIPK